MYKCIKCKEIVKELPKGFIRCPNCAGRILFKVRAATSKEVQAR